MSHDPSDHGDPHAPPLILVTNDDGVTAAGLAILAERLKVLGEVLVVAPAEEQSAVAHAISLNRPLRLRRVAADTYAVSGTPADAVLLGLFHIARRRPALVVSGINSGLNVGTDVLYSGTVAGALEGAIHGVPALAVSQEIPEGELRESSPPWRELLETAASVAACVARRILADPRPGLAVNLNLPVGKPTAYAWTRLGRRVYREQVEQRLDLRGRPYFWVGGPVLRGGSPPGTDAHAVEAGLISLTPLALDLTAAVSGWYDGWEIEGYRRADGAA